ncbi:hypothetical protein OESDEN_22212 [Oesophagostomum dentatum]|uniref:Uncharacterized protein n=1 Tax=Oesophagostomum dentatum TaxID=61180 RepID=A0A0B1RYP6_OESDE|nr:hypothetical protein OESDEN_22212 [Oesophagostomum dentatum]
MLAQRLIDQTALSMMENRADGVAHLADNALLNGGLEGVLSFLASTGDNNPLSLLSAAAAASEQSSCAVTPNLLVKEEPREAAMEIDAVAQATQVQQNHLNGRVEPSDPDATPPAEEEPRLVVDEQPQPPTPTVASSC